jgi:L-2-hydroxyglutarate oxidase LhgO
MTDTLDTLVIGAGAVGLAVARRLALAGREVVVAEAGDTIGGETSSRNSEVIHAGLYYPPGSLKARLCVAGRRALYRFLAEHGVAHAAVGKLVVATSEEEIPALDRIRATAEANGVEGLARLDAAAARRLEPALNAVAALHSPVTGILDSHACMLALQGEAEAHGGMVAFRTPVVSGRVVGDGIEIRTGGAEPMTVTARCVVNAAGLHAQTVAAAIAGLPLETVPPRRLAKGSYFVLAGRAPFRRLVYPVPQPGGLGVHLTLDLGGQARFGPDVEWVETIDYDLDPRRADAFYAAVRRYWPGLPDGALLPGYTGIRPKLAGPGAPAADFLVQGPEAHGVAGLVNLYGIESPGLTAALALADLAAARLGAGGREPLLDVADRLCA